MLWSDPITVEAGARRDKILDGFKYGSKEKVTMDLLPVEAYMIECFRIIGQDGRTHNTALAVLVFKRQYRLLTQGEKSNLYLAAGTDAPKSNKRRRKVPELHLV